MIEKGRVTSGMPRTVQRKRQCEGCQKLVVGVGSNSMVGPFELEG